MENKKIARLANLAEDYTRFNIQREISIREDGHRTCGKPSEYEWWYFNGKMDDGSSLVITFSSQPASASARAYEPSMTFSLTINGQHIQDSASFAIEDCSFDRNQCCVKMGSSYFADDLRSYIIRYQTDRVDANITLTPSAAPWRPETGHILFDESKYFAWLAAVPEGKVDAVVTVDGKTYTFTGNGYHDHHWGNAGMFWLIHHWYWGRATIGDYQIISSYITAHKKYRYEHFPIFLLLKNGEKLADDPQYVTYTQSDPEFDPITKKHYHKKLVYDYDDGTQHYRITYTAEQITETFTVADSNYMAQAKASPLLLLLVKLAGLSPSYLHLTGTVTLERFKKNIVVERIKAPTVLFEQMYFGQDEDV